MMVLLSNLPIIMMAVFVAFMGVLIVTSDRSPKKSIDKHHKPQHKTG